MATLRERLQQTQFAGRIGPTKERAALLSRSKMKKQDEKQEKKTKRVSKETPLGFAAGFAAEIARAPVRSLVSVGLEPAAGFITLLSGREKKAEFVPETGLEKAIFGKEPILGLFERQEAAAETIEELSKGAGVSESLSKRLGAAGAPVVIGLATGLDLGPVGGGGGKLSKKAMKELTERIGKEAAERIAKEGGEKAVKEILKHGDGVVPQVFRADKLNLPLEQTEEIQKRLMALGLDTRKVRSFGEMQDAAGELATDVGSLLRETKAGRITDAEVVALRESINSNAQFVAKSQKALNEATDDATRRVLATRIGQAEQQIDEAVKKVVRGGTEAGRAVVSYRIMARNNLDPSYWLTKVQKVSGKDLTPETIEAVNDLIKQKDVNALATFVSLQRSTTLADKSIALWKAGLLTAPTTHLANTLGNVTMRVLLNAADVAALPFDVTQSLITKKRTITTSPRLISAQVKGLIDGVKRGTKFMRTGVYDEALLQKYDFRQVNFGSSKMGKLANFYTQTIFKSLGAEDIVFRQVAMSDALKKSAILTAKNEGLRGSALTARIRSLLQNPTMQMQSDAIDAAEFATFQNRNTVADLISGLRRGKGLGGEAVKVATEVTAPFVRTPTNIAARIFDFSPAGFVKAIFKAVKPTTRSQKAFAEDMGRAITGTGVMALGGYLASKGKMTGNVPTSQAEREQFFAEGKQANAILVDGKWMQMNRFSPFGNLLALGAEAHELSKESPDMLTLATETGFAGLKGLTEQTFLRGVSGGLKALTEPERSAEKFLKQVIASSIPTILKGIGRTKDPHLRLSENPLEATLERMPILREQLPIRRDIFGEPVKVPGGKATLVDPFGTKEAVDDPIINEAKSLGLAIGMPAQTISGQKLTNQEYSAYQLVQGRVLKEVLTSVINTPEYGKLSSVDKEKIFKSAVRTVRSEINDTVFPALMIAKFDLSPDTNPQDVRNVLKELNDNDKFKKANAARQKEIVQKIFDAANAI